MTAAEGITAKSGPQIDLSDCTIRQNECLPYTINNHNLRSKLGFQVPGNIFKYFFYTLVGPCVKKFTSPRPLQTVRSQ